MKILKSKFIKNESPKWLLPRGARLIANIALFRYTLINEEGQNFKNSIPLIPCLAGSNSVLRGIEAEPGILRVPLNFLADANFDFFHSVFSDGLLEISQGTPEMGFGGNDPQLGEFISLRPLDSSSGDTQSRWRVTWLFLSVIHQNVFLDMDVELGVNPTDTDDFPLLS